jgi:hypothetical protein
MYVCVSVSVSVSVALSVCVCLCVFVCVCFVCVWLPRRLLLAAAANDGYRLAALATATLCRLLRPAKAHETSHRNEFPREPNTFTHTCS